MLFFLFNSMSCLFLIQYRSTIIVTISHSQIITNHIILDLQDTDFSTIHWLYEGATQTIHTIQTIHTLSHTPTHTIILLRVSYLQGGSSKQLTLQAKRKTAVVQKNSHLDIKSKTQKTFLGMLTHLLPPTF